MKKIFFFIILAALLSCHKNNPQPPAPSTGGVFNLNITNKVNGKNLVINQKYVTAQGDSFYIVNFKYYISNFEFFNLENGNFYTPSGSYYLVDASNPASTTLQASNVQLGDYNEFTFSIGVDNERNHTGAQTGALDPTVNADMFWTWSSGYKFLLLEGYYLSSPGVYSPFVFHIGGDDNYKIENFNTYGTTGWNTDINIQTGKTSTLNVTFNVDQILNNINLDSINNVMAGSEATVIANYYANMPQLTGISNQ